MGLVELLGDRIVAGHVESDLVDSDRFGIDVLIVAQPVQERRDERLDDEDERVGPVDGNIGEVPDRDGEPPAARSAEG